MNAPWGDVDNKSGRYADLVLKSTKSADRLSRSRQQAVHDAALDAIVTVDAAGAVVEFNHSAEQVFGYRREEVVGRRMVDLIVPPALRAAHEHGFQRYLASGEAQVLGKRLELPAVRADGTEFPIELSIVRLAQPGPPVFTAFIRDLSERVRGERFAAQAKAIVGSSFDAIVGRSMDGTVTSWNGSAERIFGYTADEMIGRPMQKLVPSERAGELEEITEHLRLEGRLDPFETTRRHKNGQVVHVETTASPITDSGGTMVGVSSLSRDITERKRSELLVTAQAKLLALVAAGRPVPELLDLLNRLLVEGASAATATVVTPHEAAVGGDAQRAPNWAGDIRAGDGSLVGTLALTYPTPCKPPRGDVELAAVGLDAVRIAIGRLRADEALRDSEYRYRDLFENASEPIATVTLDNIITETNAAFQRTLGYTEEELLGTSLRDYLTDEGYATARREGERKLSGEVSATSFEQEFIARDGTLVVMHISSRVIEEHGRPVGIQGTCRDVTAYRQAQAQLLALAETNRHQALHDSLTGLPNRPHFGERLDAALESHRESDAPFTVLMIDLSRFKQINDSFGHPRGDMVLRSIALRLQQATRETDTVARLGGDEFGMIITRCGDSDNDALSVTVARIVAALQEPVELQGVPIHVEANIGSASCPSDGADAELLLQRADTAMYDAKQKGITHARFGAQAPQDEAGALVLLAEIPRAIRSRELRLDYQPQLALQTKLVTRVEALVRWDHPTRGLVPPGDFVPAAERTALIEPLTAFVLDTALAQAGRWRVAGIDVEIAVNLSMRNLHDVTLPTQLENLIRRWRMPSDRITLEITESAIASDPQRAEEIIRQLNALGIRIAIDDFGIGYTSLAHLSRLPISQIKIDRSFVADLDTQPGHVSIVRSIIALGHDLGLEVVAEGVETPSVRAKLELLDCDTIQGYLIGRPGPAADVEPSLQRGSSLKPRRSIAAVA